MSLNLFILILLVTGAVSLVLEEHEKDEHFRHEIVKRGLFWPQLLFPLNAATGILVAVAVPLHDIDRNVFLAYNFEANYNLANVPSDSFPGPPFKRWKLGSTYEDMSVDPSADTAIDDSFARSLNKGNETVMDEEVTTTEESNSIDDVEANEITKRSLLDRVVLSRKGVYRVLESRISANGIDGKKCLLRAICESASNSLLEANGVLGHILHIILTPSSSKDENLPSEYNKAEELGLKKDCTKYKRKCDFSLLDALSSFV
ncbi:unnamed protein product [Chironomus riparius]|uniref:Uncharacterized protein n=1 Tax=Chironomus riparius TaxID=315576 RepID=A0A9N9WYK1_9DIPT|nr:unnamed protein product [Chironomus riparius]